MSRGKKIDTWEFMVNSTSMKVEVRMVTDREGVNFWAHKSEYDLSLRNADINALRLQVGKHLREQQKIAWSRYLQVTFTGACSVEADREVDAHEEEVTSIAARNQFEATEIEIGLKSDGSKCWRVYSKNANGYVEDGIPFDGREDAAFGSNPSITCILPATDENRKAIRGIRDAFRKLNDSMFSFLAPDKVEANIKKKSNPLKLTK